MTVSRFHQESWRCCNPSPVCQVSLTTDSRPSRLWRSTAIMVLFLGHDYRRVRRQHVRFAVLVRPCLNSAVAISGSFGITFSQRIFALMVGLSYVNHIIRLSPWLLVLLRMEIQYALHPLHHMLFGTCDLFLMHMLMLYPETNTVCY